MVNKLPVVRRYITKSGTIYDHVSKYSRNGDAKVYTNCLVMRKGEKCYLFEDWAYLPKKVLENYDGQSFSSIGEKLLSEYKNKEPPNRHGKILFKDSNARFGLTSIVEHIQEPTMETDIKLAPEEE